MLRLFDTSLRRMLTLPYVALLLCTAAIIGLLSYAAGRNAVDTLSNHVLAETVGRIAQAVDRHVAGSEAVLETAFPDAVPAPDSLVDEMDTLRTRFWLATSIHRDPNNYAYYGDREGRFFGVYRLSDNEAELRLRVDGSSPRRIHRYSGINGILGEPVVEQRIFEPRDRPWYKAGQDSRQQTWTAIYIDFRTLELVSTRARRVEDADGDFAGVVATDLSLQLLNDFLRTLPLTASGVAFIVEPDGNLVATSRGPHIRQAADGGSTRLNALDSSAPLIMSTYRSVSELTRGAARSDEATTGHFEDDEGRIVQTGYVRLQDSAGLDWIIAVAVPREDFMFQVTRNVERTVALVLLACVLIGIIGFIVLNIITRDLRQLARATRSIADGVSDPDIPIHRNDEIGELATAIADMQRRLLIDRLTGIANRDAILRRIENRILDFRRRADPRPFAVLFIDLDGFKAINDRWGHDIGDQVLVELAQRLERSMVGKDIAARYGGDEFLVLLDEVPNAAVAARVRERLENVLSEPLKTLERYGEQVGVMANGGTIGMALCAEHGNDVESLIKAADEDMYQRKRAMKAGLSAV